MKLVNGVAVVALALMPALAHAQTAPNADGECDDGNQLADDGQCYPVAVGATGQGPLPVLGTIPAGAIVVGGVVVLAGVVIGVAAATDDDDAAVSTTATSTN